MNNTSASSAPCYTSYPPSCEVSIPHSYGSEQFYLAMTHLSNTASAERLQMQAEMDRFYLMMAKLHGISLCESNTKDNDLVMQMANQS